MTSGVIIGFLLIAILLPLAINEAGELAPWLAKLLLRWGARCLGSARSTERYTEEWMANLEYVPGKLTKLAWACGILLWSVPQLRWQLHRRARRQMGPTGKSSDHQRTTEPAFEDFFRVQYQPVVALIMLIWRDHAAAEDLAQEAFLAVRERWPEINNPKAYVMHVAINMARQREWGRLREEEALSKLAGDVIVGQKNHDPILQAEADARQTEVDEMLAVVAGTLSPRQRQIHELSVVEGLVGEKLAVELGKRNARRASQCAREIRLMVWERFGALVLARHGGDYCADLGSILDEAGWEGENFTRELCFRILRHLNSNARGDNCAICNAQRPKLIADYAP